MVHLPALFKWHAMADLVGLRLVVIGVRDLAEWWPRCLPLIEKWLPLCDGEWENAAAVYEDVAAKNMQLWLAEAAGKPAVMTLTRILNSRGHRTCQIVGAASDGAENRGDWLPYLVDIERWAKQSGCDRLRLDGRPGWERVMSMNGYKRLFTVLTKDIL